MRTFGLCLLLLAASACGTTPKLPAVNEFCVKTGAVPASLADLAAERGSDDDVAYILGLIESRKLAGC